MEELWRGYTVDGSTAFAPGDDYGEDEGQDAWPQEEEEEVLLWAIVNSRP